MPNTFNIAQFQQEYLAFEQEMRVFDKRLRGLPVWDYLRGFIFAKIFDTKMQAAPPHVAGAAGLARMAKAIKAAGTLIWGLFYILWYNLTPKKPCTVMVVNYGRLNVIDGKTVEMNLYPLIKHLRARHELLVLDPSTSPRGIKNTYQTECVFIHPFILFDKLKARCLRFTPEECQWLEKMSVQIQKHFGVAVDLLALARQHFRHDITTYWRYQKFLRNHRPKVILFAHQNKSIMQAANEVGIPNIELQHSLISPLNIAYNYEGITATLPTRPSHIFTFGTYWNDELIMPIKKVVVGYPYFEIKKAEAATTPAALKALTPHPEKCVIIIANYFSKPLFVDLALKLAHQLPDHTIFYKLKLTDYAGWQDRYPAAFRSTPNLRVIDNNDISLYQYFSRCRYQIGVNSGALYEGLSFGLTTFILSAPMHEESARLYLNGHAFLVNDALTIIKAIRSGAQPEKPLDCDAVYQRDSLNNMQTEIDRLLEIGT